LIDEWVKAIDLIYCHAFDQAALQLILLRSVRHFYLSHRSDAAAHRMYGPLIQAQFEQWARAGSDDWLGTHDQPLGFTCIQPRCSQNVTKGPHWSCNPLFDHILNRTGFGLFLRGGQNYPVLDLAVWISKEDATRPRLHVVEKDTFTGLPTHYEGWEYGGNFPYDLASAPHDPTWFLSHHKQSSTHFFAAHQTRRACGDSMSACGLCVVEPAFVTRSSSQT
jgi:hypothetical protein